MAELADSPVLVVASVFAGTLLLFLLWHLAPRRAEGGGSWEETTLGFPVPPEARHGACMDATFDVPALPRASLVIPYLNETWPHIRATVRSLLAHTPLDAVDELLFVDDGNGEEWQFHRELRRLHPKVRVHRNERRQGLIRSKVIGAALARSPVIVFMEPHCIVGRQWLEPLLQRLSESASSGTVLMPTLDIIPEGDFGAYHVAQQFIGGFDWTLKFDWMGRPDARNGSYRHPDPYPTPVLSGGIFAIWREHWERVGTYDEGMNEWGGEHIEMSLRTWRCGGRIEIVPCSRIGHLFRSRNPYSVDTAEVLRNEKRAALVWLDEHLEHFYAAAPAARGLDAGDVEERLRLKAALGCRSMGWYTENVYPELLGEQRPAGGQAAWTATGALMLAMGALTGLLWLRFLAAKLRRLLGKPPSERD